ncbi:C40 family peptidase [Tumebacillus lipolyticus]|uniref:C40 family peptidase n=1 Tax=Tumebacillus lipolyticus TaxID=1280370 RepID=A0ABW4ZU96_9BACL
MKRQLRVCMLAMIMIASPVAASAVQAAPDAYGDHMLVIGSTGSNVTKLQQDLRLLGYFSYPENTGYYGEITATAVKKFQAAHGLEQNGKVGATTGPLIDQAAAKLRPATPQVVETAMKYVGVPYKWAGNTPSGFDCSGYVSYVMAQQGVHLPRISTDMYKGGTQTTSPKAGDLVFFSTYGPGATHVGIYLGNGQFISADSTYGVKVDTLSGGYWGARYIGARSYL